jgi:hypothetical protein
VVTRSDGKLALGRLGALCEQVSLSLKQSHWPISATYCVVSFFSLNLLSQVFISSRAGERWELRCPYMCVQISWTDIVGNCAKISTDFLLTIHLSVRWSAYSNAIHYQQVPLSIVDPRARTNGGFSPEHSPACLLTLDLLKVVVYTDDDGHACWTGEGADVGRHRGHTRDFRGSWCWPTKTAPPTSYE